MSSRKIISILFALFCLTLQAVTIPKEHVFVFERSTNSNYVCYDINLEDGALCQKEPLKIYWVLGDGTRIEGLTFLDRRMAYGVKVVSSGKDEALVHLAAYKDLNIRICKHKGKWVAIIKRQGREMIVQKMFAQMKPPLSVKCEYVEITGIDIETGGKRYEKIMP